METLEDILAELPDILIIDDMEDNQFYYSDIYIATLYYKDKKWHLDYLNSNGDSIVEFIGESPWGVTCAAYDYCKEEGFINE